MAKRAGGEWPGAITATEIDLAMDNIFAGVDAARKAAKLARIEARKADRSFPKNPIGNLSPAIRPDDRQLVKTAISGKPIYSVCSDASDWFIARMIVEGKLVPANLDEIKRPDWEKLFTISQ